MKRAAIFFYAAFLLPISASAQKKPLDHSVYDTWQSSAINKLSADGTILAYSVTPQAGDATLYVRNLDTGAELQIPRGTLFSMPEAGHWATVTIKAPYDSTRNAKIAKRKKEDMPKDTLAIVNLDSLTVRRMPIETRSLRMGAAAAPFIIASADVPKHNGVHTLTVINTATGATDTIHRVEGLELDRSGTRLALTTCIDKKDSLSVSSVILMNLATGRTDTLSRDKKAYKGLSFNHSGDKLLFLATSEDAKDVGTQSYGIWMAEEKTLSRATRKKPAAVDVTVHEMVVEECEGLPEGWIISEKSGVRFSNCDSRLILSLRERIPAKDTTVVDFEAPKLDIWRWDSPEIPPAAKRNSLDRKLTSVVNLSNDSSRVIVLSRNIFDNISFIQGADGPTALSSDRSAYAFQSMWDYNGYADISLVSLSDGTRTPLGERLHNAQISDHGKYLTWFDRESGDWYCEDITTRRTVNLTASTGVSFVNDERDVPEEKSSWTGRSWFGDDDFMLISDRYDIWKFRPDGQSPACLTAGAGRKAGIRYRYTDFEQNDDSHIFQNLKEHPAKGAIYLTAFDENDMRNGLATISLERPAAPVTSLGEYSYQNYVRARGSSRIIYRKGNFETPTDIHVSTDLLRTSQQITHINPQMKDYLWGKARLVSWTAYDGTPLKGILYTPENLDSAAKYPMIVYFYEKNTQNLFAAYNPAPSRSVINFPYCVSNGYVVFIPDIVYETGHPGKSAFNCIVSGAEAMCAQFSFIDRSRMALQGQSWGGYQTAYLVTQTDMFAAAEAGAPVSNMTSAYGGMRWGTGASRIGQYEHGQSRVGKTLWDEGGLDLYIENSPVFFADKVTTPLMIMSNDGDGAVPWYQGVEMFMAMRRLGKPCWLLEYNNEAHNLNLCNNSKDLSVRLMQFFDHFLKDGPLPEWMVEDIPQSLKGNKFGYETFNK